LDYLKLLAGADRSLIIHGNYLDRDEIAYVSRQRERMSVIYCPRTHAYFGHDRYPLREMLNAAVNVALGTDSRASNPDLNMLSELRFAAGRHEDISRETLLRLATINAARALGMSRTHGSLTPGKQADIIVVPVAPNDSADPHELLFESASGVEHVVRGAPLSC
jgi:cytosine/adenosine deaminase-related metal-dependent hydrolase